MRVLYGLDRLPRSVPPDDPRLPGIDLGPAPLRLNSLPIAPAILAEAGDTHAGRLAAMEGWLLAQCGDYAVGRRRFVRDYLAAITAEMARHHDTLAAWLAAYDGLYAVEDWTWSALRPLPRAWTEAGMMEVAFWDGVALQPDGALAAFWEGEALPKSPFRLPAPLSLGRGLR